VGNGAYLHDENELVDTDVLEAADGFAGGGGIADDQRDGRAGAVALGHRQVELGVGEECSSGGARVRESAREPFRADAGRHRSSIACGSLFFASVAPRCFACELGSRRRENGFNRQNNGGSRNDMKTPDLARETDSGANTSSRKAVPEGNDTPVEQRERSEGERRRPRIEVTLMVTVESESNLYVGFTENLSEGGVFVATHALRKIGSAVDLVIELAQGPTIHANGTVRWLRQYSEVNETVPGMGIRFDHLSSEDARRLHEFAKARQPLFFDDEGFGGQDAIPGNEVVGHDEAGSPNGQSARARR
jgi:uncharacterized protein (TIGR02266 family)